MKNAPLVKTFLSLTTEEQAISRNMEIKGNGIDGYEAFATLHEVWNHFKNHTDSAKKRGNLKRKVREISEDLKELNENPDDFFKIVEGIKYNVMKRSVDDYLLSFEGFMILVMSFTGPKALAIKLRFIRAFTGMAEALSLIHMNSNSGQIETIIRNEVPRDEMLDEIRELIEWEKT